MKTLSHHLDNIRQKPEHIRKHIAFWSSLGITAVIVMFWLASFSVVSHPSTTAARVGAESPWHAMAASAGDAWNSLKATFGATATYQAPPLQVSPGKQ